MADLEFKIQPMRYPPDCFDPTVPKEAREELKARISEAYAEYREECLRSYYQLLEGYADADVDDGQDGVDADVEVRPSVRPSRQERLGLTGEVGTATVGERSALSAYQGSRPADSGTGEGEGTGEG